MALTKVPSNLDATVATTQSASDNSTNIATTAYVTTALSNLVDSSPSALNTLNELAAALNDDASFSTTVNNSIATKLPLAGGTLTGNLTVQGTAGFNANGETASLYLGDTNSEIRATYGGGTKFFLNGTERMELEGSSGNLNLKTGALEINGTSVLDTSRNLANIGTISSGVINAFGASGGSNLAYASNFKANGANVQITFERGNDSTGWGGIGANNANALMVYNGSTQEKLSLTQAGNLTVAGTMASGAITSTGDFLINESANTERSVRIQNSTVTSLFGVEGSSANRFVGSAANNMFLGTTTADGIEFATNNNVRATIDSSGDAVFQGSVTIQDGSTDFTMSGDSSNNTYLISNGEFRIRPSGTSVNKFVIGSNGNTTTAGTFAASDTTLTASSVGAVALNIKRSGATGRAQFALQDESGNNLWRVGATGPGSTDFAFFDGGANVMALNATDDTVTFASHILPDANAGNDIGSSSLYWRDAYIQDVYTQDLHLSNENRKKGGNDIDGTKGDWTIQEGEENLYIINNKTGKKFKFALEEVS